MQRIQAIRRSAAKMDDNATLERLNRALAFLPSFAEATLKALEESGGYQSKAAKILNISRQAVLQRIKVIRRSAAKIDDNATLEQLNSVVKRSKNKYDSQINLKPVSEPQPPVAGDAEKPKGSCADCLNSIIVDDALLDKALTEGFDIEKDLKPTRLKLKKPDQPFSNTTIYDREIKPLIDLGIIIRLPNDKIKFSEIMMKPDNKGPPDREYAINLVRKINELIMAIAQPPDTGDDTMLVQALSDKKMAVIKKLGEAIVRGIGLRDRIPDPELERLLSLHNPRIPTVSHILRGKNFDSWQIGQIIKIVYNFKSRQKNKHIRDFLRALKPVPQPPAIGDIAALVISIDDIKNNLSGLEDIDGILGIPHYNALWHREGGIYATLKNHLQNMLDYLNSAGNSSLSTITYPDLADLVEYQIRENRDELEAAILTHDLGKKETARKNAKDSWTFRGHEEKSYELLSGSHINYKGKPISAKVLLTARYHDMHWKINYDRPNEFNRLMLKMRGDFEGSDEEFRQVVEFVIAFSAIDVLCSVHEGGHKGNLESVAQFAERFKEWWTIKIKDTGGSRTKSVSVTSPLAADPDAEQIEDALPYEFAPGTSVSGAADATNRVHVENLKYQPTISEKTILCHITADSILSEAQRKEGILNRLDVTMRNTNYSEKMVELKVDSSKDFVQQVKERMQEVKDYYKDVYKDEYENYTFKFDVACPSTDIVKDIQRELDISALAFDHEEGDIVNPESIMLALRALNSGEIDKLKAAYKFLTGKEPMSNISDINELARSITFTLPVDKADYNKIREIDDLIRENIKQAA
ncbi:MAG: helix-turn-helix domain-containing protein [Candidatus Omnitrophota bacterium]|nr:helix-turn-helix domain-containing protein [Candidatus Omnitrophota bacterium]